MNNTHENSSKELLLQDFSFKVPEDLIAQNPLPNRDDARCLVWRDGTATNRHIKDLSLEIPAGSLIILNDSRVIASRIRFQLATGGHAELLLLEPTLEEDDAWLALARPMKRFKVGTILDLGVGLKATILSVPEGSDQGPDPLKVSFSLKGTSLLEWLESNAEMPLPPYIERRHAPNVIKNQDRIRYQTVYAKPEGSVAAPTAGLHFTPEVLETLKAKGCSFASTTLHVGAGTFLPVKSSRIDHHHMHSERFLVPRDTLEQISRTKADQRPVVVIGTTALRSLEGLKQLADNAGLPVESFSDTWLRTQIFIRPKFKEDRFKPWCANALITNFHQPESTLYMLICALVGYDNASKIYSHAIRDNYRFFSYGDSSLLWL